MRADGAVVDDLSRLRRLPHPPAAAAPGRRPGPLPAGASCIRGAGQEYAVALVLPVKAFDRAKSRLSLPASDRRRIAEALAHRSIRTATSCLPEGRVHVVTDEPAAADLARRYGASVVTDDGLGLNAACGAGWAAAQAAWPQLATAVLVSDLHLLTRIDLAWLLHRTAHASRPAFVPDRHGTGTTFVGAPPGSVLPRAFGRRSAARFARAGYAEIVAAPPALRRDLDTIHDLAGGRALAGLLESRSSAS